MINPVHIFIDGSELLGWTEMSLSRSKDELTGQLSITVFMGYVPATPTIMNAARGREVTVYIGGNLAFTGNIDKRRGTGARHGDVGTSSNEAVHGSQEATRSVSIGPNEYTIQLTARGKLKALIDSSHQHPTTNIVNKPTTKQVVEKLVEPWGTEIEWLGTDIELDKVRLRDGSLVIDELHRIALENCYYMYETREGKLRVTDDVGLTTGEPVILGVNVLTFSAEQAEDKAKSKIKVKGQRTQKNVWGKDAVLQTVKELEDQWVDNQTPIIVQHYGDATPEALERRARFEANKRSATSKQVSIEVFHVQPPSGLPWDIGQLHYVEIPPEGIFDLFECTTLTYHARAEQLTTQLGFSPPPSSGAGTTGKFMGTLPQGVSEYIGLGKSRMAASGVTFASGQYPSPWSGPDLLLLPFKALTSAVSSSLQKMPPLFSTFKKTQRMPLTLPKDYESPRINR